MAKILIVDNNIDPPYGCDEIRTLLMQYNAGLGELIVESRRAPDSAFPESGAGWDAVVLSGSKTRIFEDAPWIDREMNLLRALHREKIPVLGICYGEQLMAKVFAGNTTVGASKIPEFGWTKMELLLVAKQSALFHSLPESFYSFSFHADEVYEKNLPQNFCVSVKSSGCPIQAFDLLDAPMWGVQFHPERSLDEGNKSLDRRKEREPSTMILNRQESLSLYSDKVAEEIFGNFLKVVYKGKK